MQRVGFSFADAFSQLVDDGKIVVVGKTFVFDLSTLK
jgi:hypothetical protein